MTKRIYTEQEAALYGARRICYKKGHDLETNLERGWVGGNQMQYNRLPDESPAVCDMIKCHRCDAVFTVTYPEIGTIVP